ncbi:putative enzyme related to lactoylglutathione lyase [Rhizomicrobium palustre]|uniref:Putative enzyme related to lactoylglutathione lyase n=1 Tax=Rhizomicrobium palustre TaxID=189966 RepID=A0A846MXD7_9PROT|nr:VOC family protein [Rhizomicrobium palustre]NIK87722.1 putative enzyme related to lactoylglutathione lyase [Rhizomicrobium palustre]
MARITGIGGVFFKSPDPGKLSAWYREVLGLDVQSWGGAMVSYDAAVHPGYVVWSPFKADTSHMQPSTREFMLNFAVEDLDGMVAAIEAKGVSLLGRMDEEHGRFAWILDPDGTKIELWEPAKEG